MDERTIYHWLARCDFLLYKHQKSEYKDGAMFEEVLDDLFNRVLPEFADLMLKGMLVPDDFIGVTDDVDG